MTARRIALLGGESSGKTTLAKALAAALHTAWVPEYGRERWEQLRETLSIAELVHVAARQAALEDAAAQAAGEGAWIVCDTTPLTTLQYCLADHGAAPAVLRAHAERRYELNVLCEPDFAFVQDGCRRDEAWRRAQHGWTVARLAERGDRWIAVRGPVDSRVAAVLAALQSAGG